jgi:hypothetical protein
LILVKIRFNNEIFSPFFFRTETEKCLKNAEEGGAPEAATEIAASLYDLTYNPNSKSSKHSDKIYPQVSFIFI